MDATPAARIAESLRTGMKDQALSGADLARRVGQLTGAAPSGTWVSRRVGTASRPVALLNVDPDLFLIARALEIDREKLIELVVAAIFGAEQSAQEWVPLGVAPPSDGGGQPAPDRTQLGPGELYAVPPRPTEAEYAGLPVLDPALLRPVGYQTDGDYPEPDRQ